MRASAPYALRDPARIAGRFAVSCVMLWSDRAAGRSLSATSLFWAIAAVLQFIILRWGTEVLGLPLSCAAAGRSRAWRDRGRGRGRPICTVEPGLGGDAARPGSRLAGACDAVDSDALDGRCHGVRDRHVLSNAAGANVCNFARSRKRADACGAISIGAEFFENGAAFVVLVCDGLLNSLAVSLSVPISCVGVCVLGATMAGMWCKAPILSDG